MERLPLYIDFLAFRAPLEKSRGASLLFITLLWTRVLIISLIFLFPMLRSKGQSQPVVFEWQQCYGGSDWEGGDRLIKTSAGILISGSTYSNDGQVTGYHGGGDFWLVWTDSMGNYLFSKCYGGSIDEYDSYVLPKSNNEFVIFGGTYSYNGNISGNHGDGDYWIGRIDSIGNQLWQHCYGGSYKETEGNFMMTSDSGYILGGTSNSLDGDVSNNHGLEDFWVVKLDKNLNLEWETCLGSSSVDASCSIKETYDKGYIAAGSIHRNDGDVNCSYHDDYDAWVVKLDSTGNIQWQNCYGGSLSDGFSDIAFTEDDGYILTGGTRSYDGDVTGNHGDCDVWVVKIDSVGNMQWQKCYGGIYFESSSFIKPSMDGNYYIGSITTSNNGDVSGNHSPAGGVIHDAWLIKISPSGDLLWQQCIGGFLEDGFEDLLEVEPGKLILVGGTRSLDGSGDVMCGKHGQLDVWLVCATDLTTSFQEVERNSENPIEVFPNPAGDQVTFVLKHPFQSGKANIEIYNAFGEPVARIPLSENITSYRWNTLSLPEGLYLYMLQYPEYLISGKVILKP